MGNLSGYRIPSWKLFFRILLSTFYSATERITRMFWFLIRFVWPFIFSSLVVFGILFYSIVATISWQRIRLLILFLFFVLGTLYPFLTWKCVPLTFRKYSLTALLMIFSFLFFFSVLHVKQFYFWWYWISFVGFLFFSPFLFFFFLSWLSNIFVFYSHIFYFVKILCLIILLLNFFSFD